MSVDLKALRESIMRDTPQERAFRHEIADDVLSAPSPDPDVAEFHQAALTILAELESTGGREQTTEEQDTTSNGLAARRRSGGQRGGNQYGPTTVRHASPKQTSFLAALLRDRDYSGKGDRQRAEIDRAAAELATGKVALRLASDAIDALLTCPPKARQEGAAASTTFATDKQVAVIRKNVPIRVAGEDVLRVALEARGVDDPSKLTRQDASKLIDILFSAEYKPREQPSARAELSDGVYLYDGAIYAVVHAQGGSGRQYAKRLVPVEHGSARWEYAKGIIYRLTPAHELTREQAREYGSAYGVCARCGRTLSNDDSIERMMGPVCYGKTRT